jgi:alanyl-tRNA synthetase
MTTPLYLDDTYLDTHTAALTAAGADDRGTYVILDQTIFYPQGGGQPSDCGTIMGDGFTLSVHQVRLAETEIRHYIVGDQPSFSVPVPVTIQIDRERRMMNARYHTAAHLLGNVVETMVPTLKAVKGHSFPGESYVEFMGASAIDPDGINQAMAKAINDNLSTRTFDMDAATFERLYYKLPYETPGNKAFRAMQIGDYPPVPCGGTHLQAIGEIGIAQATKVKVKDGTVKISYEVSS